MSKLKAITSVRNVRRYGKPIVFLACLYPAAWLALQWYFAYTGQPHGLGFNFFEFTNRYTGDWALRFLLIALAVTPVAKLTKSFKPILFRRMLGLFAFFYVTIHMCSYVFLDLEGNMAEFIEAIAERLFITVGMLAFMLLIPLAATSFDKAQHWLGLERWRKLHKLVYIITPLGILHFYMMQKTTTPEPFIYLGIYILLMAIRYLDKRRAKA